MVCVCFCHMLSIRLPYKACTRKPSALGKAPKNLLANAGDVGSIPGSGRPLEKEKATHPSILAWEILQTEGPGGLQFMGSLKESDMTAQLNNNNFYNSCPGSMGCLSHHGPGPSPTCIHSPVSSITQSCPTPCHPKDCSMPGFSVHLQFPEVAQTYVCHISDAIQPSHPLSSLSPLAFSLSQH